MNPLFLTVAGPMSIANFLVAASIINPCAMFRLLLVINFPSTTHKRKRITSLNLQQSSYHNYFFKKLGLGTSFKFLFLYPIRFLSRLSCISTNQVKIGIGFGKGITLSFR